MWWHTGTYGRWSEGETGEECVASTLHTTSEHGVSSITNANAHTSAASSRLNRRPRRFKWTRPFRRKTKSGFCACAITFQMQSTSQSASSDDLLVYEKKRLLRPLAKLRKAAISFVVSVCPPVRMELGWHWTDFHEIWHLSMAIFENISTICRFDHNMKERRVNLICVWPCIINVGR
jgi:hypothetical protein